MKITFHGVDAGGLLRKNNHACVEISSGEESVLFDAGSIPESPNNNLSAIFLSHLHPDHIYSLPMILLNQKLYTHSNTQVFIPCSKLVQDFLQATGLNCEVKDLLNGRKERIGSFNITPFGNSHAQKISDILPMTDLSSYSFKIEADNHRILYSGDVGNFNEIIDLLDCTLSYDIVIIEGAHYDLSKIETMPDFLKNRMPKKVFLIHTFCTENYNLPDWVIMPKSGESIEV